MVSTGNGEDKECDIGYRTSDSPLLPRSFCPGSWAQTKNLTRWIMVSMKKEMMEWSLMSGKRVHPKTCPTNYRKTIPWVWIT